MKTTTPNEIVISEEASEAARNIRLLHRGSYSPDATLQGIYENIIDKAVNASTARLLLDKARLDWLEKEGTVQNKGINLWQAHGLNNSGSGTTVRAAIDAAMKYKQA